MLTIREEQLRLIAEDGLRRWLHNYLAECYPAQVQRLGCSALARSLKGLIAKAHGRGFYAPEDIRKYVHVGFLLGPEFEAKYAWAGAILDDPELDDPGWRAKSLEEAAVEFLCPAPPEPAFED